jgi:hypothetical protein
MSSPGGTPVAAIDLKSISATIPNVVASNCGGSSVAQKATNTNTQKGLGHFSPLNPLVAAQKAANANTKKGLGRFSQLNPLVKLWFYPARVTCQALALARLLYLSSSGFSLLALLVELWL